MSNLIGILRNYEAKRVECKPKYEKWVDEKFIEYFDINMSSYSKLYKLYQYVSEEEIEKLLKGVKDFAQTLKNEVLKNKNIETELNASKEELEDYIDYWKGAYMHGELDELESRAVSYLLKKESLKK